MAIHINGEAIPEAAIQYELDRLVKFYSRYMSAQAIREQMDALKTKAKDQAIGAKLLVNESRRLDIKVPQADIDARLQAMVQRVGGQEAFLTLLKKQDITEDIVKDSIEQGRRVDLLVEKLTTGISDPTEEEMRAHFKEHEDEYVKSDRAQVQHILIKPESNGEADKGTARSRLMEVRRSIEEGANFEDQAAAHSQCPSGKKTGGSLGWISKGMTAPELDRAIFSMEIGELSDVVESQLGLHILKKTAHEEGGKADYAEVAEDIRDFLRHAKRGIVLSDYVAELRKKAEIEEECCCDEH
jgi:parvulin-like peptidyl-prolyl isomerase